MKHQTIGTDENKHLRRLVLCILTGLLCAGTAVTASAEELALSPEINPLTSQMPLLIAPNPMLNAEKPSFTSVPDMIPSGIAKTDDGFVVTDLGNCRIWKTAGGSFDALTGTDTVPAYGYVDGALAEVCFCEPWAVTAFGDGYAISDTEAHVVRYLDENGVSTLAGSGKDDNLDGSILTAAFGMPTGLAAGEDSALYIADTAYGTIRVLNNDGTVSTLLDGLCEPTGLCWADGVLYIAETGKNRILTYENGTLDVLAGNAVPDPDAEEEDVIWQIGFANGKAENAMFNHPQGIAVSEDGLVYIADTDNSAVRVFDNGFVYTLAQTDGSADSLASPRGIVFADDDLYVTDIDSREVSVIPTEKERFADVAENAWYADAVEKAVLYGITVGTGDGKFSPDMTLTRAMAITMLSRVHSFSDGFEVIAGDAVFDDVAVNAWYADPVSWAADRSITCGVGDDLYAPDRIITRQELITLVYRYAQSIRPEIEATEENLADAQAKFSDWDTVSDYAKSALAWASANGIIKGLPGGIGAPEGEIDRAQAVQIMVSFLNALNA